MATDQVFLYQTGLGQRKLLLRSLKGQEILQVPEGVDPDSVLALTNFESGQQLNLKTILTGDQLIIKLPSGIATVDGNLRGLLEEVNPHTVTLQTLEGKTMIIERYRQLTIERYEEIAVSVSYNFEGWGWRPIHHLLVSEDEKSAQLTSWAEIEGPTNGRSNGLMDIDLNLVMGKPKTAPRPAEYKENLYRAAPMASAQMMSRPSPAEQMVAGTDDLITIQLGRRHLARGVKVKLISLPLTLRKVYYYSLANGMDLEFGYRVDDFKSETILPGGKIEIFRNKGADISPDFLGTTKFHPKKIPIDLRLGASELVQGFQVPEVSERKEGNNIVTTSKYQATFTNKGTQEALVIISFDPQGQKIQGSTCTPTRTVDGRLEYELRVPPKNQATFQCQYVFLRPAGFL